MVNFSKEELLRLAEISALQLDKEEVERLQEQLLITIDYTRQLDAFDTADEHEAVKTINVFREDKAIPSNSKALLDQAPQKKDTYFVVPKILESDE